MTLNAPNLNDVTAVYNSMAESYDNVEAEPFYANQYRAYHRMLARQLTGRCQSALDLGCGTGIFAEALAGKCDRVVGIDVSTELLRLAREKCSKYPNVSIQECSATDLPFENGEFDFVVSFGETLSHIEDYPRAFSEMARVLRPGGHFIFSVLNKWCFRLAYSPNEFFSAISSKRGYWRIWKCEDDQGNPTALPLRTFSVTEVEALTSSNGLELVEARGIHIFSLLIPLSWQRKPSSLGGEAYTALGRFDEGLSDSSRFQHFGYTCIYAGTKPEA